MMMRWLMLLMAVLLHSVALADPVPLDDSQLSAVDGQQGIGFQIEMFWNASRDSSNTATPNNDAVPLASLGNCAAATSSPCTLSLQLADRNGNTSPCMTVSSNCPGNGLGQWLAFNNFFAGMRIYSLNLDGGNLASASSNAAYWDPTKFQNPSGGCLLYATFGTSSTAACPTTLTGSSLTAMNGLNALEFSMPVPTVSLTHGLPGVAGGEASTGYNSILLGMNVGRMAVQFGTTKTTAGTNNGYINDTGNSFAGFAIGDTASDDYAISRGATANTVGAPGTFGTPTNVLSLAGAAITGKAYIFGF